MSDKEALIRVEGLKKYYRGGKIKALDGVDAEIFPGEESVSLIISGYQGVTLVPMPDLTRVTTLGGLDQILDVYGVTERRFLFSEITKGSSGSENALVVAQSPSAGLPFLPSETTVEITLYSDYAKSYRADVAFELVVDSDDTEVEVRLLSDYGEFVLHRELVDKSLHADIAFQAGFLKAGEYTLIVYTNGTEAMRLSAEFTERR